MKSWTLTRMGLLFFLVVGGAGCQCLCSPQTEPEPEVGYVNGHALSAFDQLWLHSPAPPPPAGE